MRPRRIEQMRELGLRHARLESQRRLEPLLETLVPEPVYEFHTVGRCLRGGAQVRRYYRQFFDDYLRKVTGGERIGLWVSESAFVLESAIHVTTEAGPEVQRVIAVLFAAGDRLGGERVYASERVVRMMAGSMFEELEPLRP